MARPASAHEEHGFRTAVHLDGTVEITVVATKTKATVFNYVVLNYEKFQQSNRDALVNELAELGPGFVVFDEVQLVKVREEHAVSRRREALEALVSELAERDPGLRVLGMSATRVINNLLEARKLLEIVTCRSHADLATQPTVDNALDVCWVVWE